MLQYTAMQYLNSRQRWTIERRPKVSLDYFRYLWL